MYFTYHLLSNGALTPHSTVKIIILHNGRNVVKFPFTMYYTIEIKSILKYRIHKLHSIPSPILNHSCRYIHVYLENNTLLFFLILMSVRFCCKQRFV